LLFSFGAVVVYPLFKRAKRMPLDDIRGAHRR
jgi:hypothetical protein